MTIKETQSLVYRTAQSKGWYTSPPDADKIGAQLALIHSEVSEALECLRERRMVTYCGPDGKPEGFEIELADAAIRIMNTMSWLGYDLETAIETKNKYNAKRERLHGNKAL